MNSWMHQLLIDRPTSFLLGYGSAKIADISPCVSWTISKSLINVSSNKRQLVVLFVVCSIGFRNLTPNLFGLMKSRNTAVKQDNYGMLSMWVGSNGCPMYIYNIVICFPRVYDIYTSVCCGQNQQVPIRYIDICSFNHCGMMYRKSVVRGCAAWSIVFILPLIYKNFALCFILQGLFATIIPPFNDSHNETTVLQTRNDLPIGVTQRSVSQRDLSPLWPYCEGMAGQQDADRSHVRLSLVHCYDGSRTDPWSLTNRWAVLKFHLHALTVDPTRSPPAAWPHDPTGSATFPV